MLKGHLGRVMRSLGLKPTDDDLTAILIASGAMDPIPDRMDVVEETLGKIDGFDKTLKQVPMPPVGAGWPGG